MRNVLKYFYNFSFDSLEEHNEYAVILDLDEIYIFKHFIGNVDELKSICDALRFNNIKYHDIVLNKDEEIITKYNNKNYILIKLNHTSEIVNDSLFYIPVPKKDIDIPLLWSEKIDYFSRQISELALGKDDLINSFNYYVGLAENAIALYRRSEKLEGEIQYSISHKRINYPNYALNYYDPTNMIIDSRVRDVSEYIKSKFFTRGVSIVEFDAIVSKYNFNHKEVNILYARLFYPDYYFDLFEDNIVSDEDTKKILGFLDKAKDYEEFLFRVYEYYKILNPVFEIEWIKPTVQH